MKIVYLSFLGLFLSYLTATAAVDSVFTSLPQDEFETKWYDSWDPGEWAAKAKNSYDMFDSEVLLANTLIISEFCQISRNHSYIEFTNVGTEDVDLSKYIYAVRRFEKDPSTITAAGISRMFSIALNGTLKPNETYIIMAYRYVTNTDPNIPDAMVPSHNKYLERRGDVFINANDKKAMGTDGTLYADGTPVWHLGRSYDAFLAKSSSLNMAGALYKVIGDTAQVVVDCVEQLFEGRATVAGIFNAINLNAMVRKKFADGRTYGNPNFIVGSGRQAADESEWILIPRYNTGTTNLFTSIGSHDPNSTYSITAKEGSNVVIDEANSTITVPYPTFRGDSIVSSLILGNDMAWEFKTNGVAEEEASVIIHTADSITFYHCGTIVETKSYRLEVGPPLPSSALLFSADYDITFGLEVDTIYGDLLTYDYSVDSLLKYIQYSPGTDIEVSYVDNVERPLLKTFDKLIVTSADKSNTHEYAVKLLPYSTLMSDIARLNTITWPDYPVDELDEYVWTKGDTIPAFNSNGLSYIITLPEGTTEIPALTAAVEHPRANLQITSATDLHGSVLDQTTRFIVTAEDDSTVNTYSVRFIVEHAEKQEFLGEPFISELAENGDGSMMVEIVNPSTDMVDMSKYILVQGKSSDKTLATTLVWDLDSYFRNNTLMYRPGYVLDSIKSASQADIFFDLNGDADVDSYVEPGNTFTLASTRGQAYGWGHISNNSSVWRGGRENGIINGPSVVLHHSDVEKLWDFNKHGGEDIYRFGRCVGVLYKENTFFLLKITNDSIFDATKGALDPTAYEIIDVVGKIEQGTTVGWLRPWDGAPCFPDVRGEAGNLQRLPTVYKGNPVSMGSFGYEGIETPENYDVTAPVLGDSAAFEWNYFDAVPSNFDIGHHAMDVTVHKSTVNSIVYEVSTGFSTSESISGVITGTTVADMLGNLIKVDAGQSLMVTSSAGTPRTDSDVAQDGDMVIVTSADTKNISMYVVAVSGPLNSDVSLASSAYTVGTSDISGVTKTTTLREVKATLSVNDLSSFYFVNKTGAILPLKMVNLLDTVYRDVVVTEELSVKVVAQSGATKLYSFNLGTTSADAFVTSSVYAVVESTKEISGVMDGANVETLLSNLMGSHNATVTVINRLGQERAFGILVKDDQVKVVSEDKSNTVIYDITLITETIRLKLGVEENEATGVSLNVFPNPTTGNLTISSSVVDVTIYNLSSAVVKTVVNPEGKLNISALANGVYLLKMVTVDGKVFVSKIIKE